MLSSSTSSIHVPQPVQGNSNPKVPRRFWYSHSYDQLSGCNPHHQGIPSFPTHARFPSEISQLYGKTTDSLISTYSGLSWSGSSNTQNQSSPVTPDLHDSLDTTLESHNDTFITAFLSEFCGSGDDANQPVRLSGYDARRLDPFGKRDGMRKRDQKHLEPPVISPADHANPDEETSIPISSYCMPSDVRKSRRFCRDFREYSRSNLDFTHDESPGLTKDLRATRSPSSHTFSLEHDLLPPPSDSGVSKLFSEKETAAVREFLRVWGSNNRVKMNRSKSALGEDEVLGSSDDDYSWEADGTEDGAWDPAQCSMLLHEVSEMVGLPPEQPIEDTVASTPPTLDRLMRSDQGISQSPGFPSSCLSVALARSSTELSDRDGLDAGGSPDACRHVDQPLDVHTPITCDLLVGNGTPTCGSQDESVTSKLVDVPNVLASSPDATSLQDPPSVLFLNRQLTPSRARSADGHIKRHGQVFKDEETRIPVASADKIAVHLENTYIPTREPPPPSSLPTFSEEHVSALDFSLSKLKAHGSQHWKSSGTEKTGVSGPATLKYGGPLLSTQSTTRGYKCQSGATTRIAYPRSARGRHFSTPVHDVIPERIVPRPATAPTGAPLRERAAKLFPCPENLESMRSFMEMDAAPQKAQAPRRTSRLGRVAARWSQGLANFGKNFIASRGTNECA